MMNKEEESSSKKPNTSPEAPMTSLSDDLLLQILSRLEDDPRDLARLACVSPRLSGQLIVTCFQARLARSLPPDLLPATTTSSSWAHLQKLSVCCPGLRNSGILLENSDFGLERDIGPDLSLYRPTTISPPSSSTSIIHQDPSSASGIWSLFDDLYSDAAYDWSELQNSAKTPTTQPPPQEEGTDTAVSVPPAKRKQEWLGPVGPHLATGPWTLSREQGNKLLASRFRGDRLYICDWPGCVHVEEKRTYKVFRGVLKDFKRSKVWRTICDTKRGKVALECAFCDRKEAWDLHSAFCLRSFFGFHDDGEPVVRAYVCDNGHVSGAWTERPMYS